jgi:uncharacterized protein (TIGR00730 family)
MMEGHDVWQLKLVSRAIKELRYGYGIFNAYKGKKRVSIFGSARTPEDHPDYLAASAFSEGMAQMGWMCITGAANGIMKAGLEGTKSEGSFGLSIKLPFEIPTNSVIHGDPKLIAFRYFFTRKLMFISHADAVAAFPGGFGTLDELYETLTLMQTGKSNILPLVLMEGKNGDYWHYWHENTLKHLLNKGWISPEDQHLFYVAKDVKDGVEHIRQFYRRYHSSRYVKDDLVIRLLDPLTEEQVEKLNQKFALLVQSGKMHMRKPFPEETEHLDYPRLVFHHTRRDFGLVRALIDEINRF